MQAARLGMMVASPSIVTESKGPILLSVPRRHQRQAAVDMVWSQAWHVATGVPVAPAPQAAAKAAMLALSQTPWPSAGAVNVGTSAGATGVHAPGPSVVPSADPSFAPASSDGGDDEEHAARR